MGWRKRERKMLRRVTRLQGRVQEADRALRLQRREYDRRLDELNNESARIKASQAVSVSREKFDAFAEAVNRFQQNVTVRMAAVAGGATAAWYFVQKVFKL